MSSLGIKFGIYRVYKQFGSMQHQASSYIFWCKQYLPRNLWVCYWHQVTCLSFMGHICENNILHVFGTKSCVSIIDVYPSPIYSEFNIFENVLSDFLSETWHVKHRRIKNNKQTHGERNKHWNHKHHILYSTLALIIAKKCWYKTMETKFAWWRLAIIVKILLLFPSTKSALC